MRSLTIGIKVFVLHQFDSLLCHQLCHILGNSGSGGQTGRFDTGCVNETFHRSSNNEITGAAHSTQTTEGGNGLAKGNGTHIFQSFLDDLIETFLSGGGIFFIGHVYRSRTSQQVTVHSGAYQNTLTHLGRSSEYGVRNHTAALFVQQDVFAAARMYIEGFVANHASDLIGIKSRCIDHNFSGNLLIVISCADLKTFFGLADAGYLKVTQQFCTVVHSVTHCCNSQFVGADDGAGGCVQGAGHRLRKIRLQSVQFFLFQNSQVANTVFLTAGQQTLDFGVIFFVKTNNQRSVSFVFYTQLLSYGFHHFGTFYIELGF